MKNLLELSKKNIPSYGIYITMQDPQLIEMAKCAGYDFGRLDAEHVNFSPQTLAEMFRMARLLDFPLQIRVGSRENIDPILALEPSAVMFPDVQTKSDAERIVEQTKFYPLGSRGMYAFTDGIRFGGYSRENYIANANNWMHTIVQIESRQGLDNLERILEIPGVDMISSGKADLSQALGIPGDTKNPRVKEAEEYIVRTAISYGKAPTLYVESKERIEELHNMGVNLFIVGFDCSLLMNAFKERRKIYIL